MEGLNFKEIGMFEIPLPDTIEQKQIVSIISNANNQLRMEMQYKSQLESLKKSLMQKLLND